VVVLEVVVVVLVVVDELVLVDALVEGASAAPIVVAGARESPVVAASDPQAPASNARATVNTATAGVRSGAGRCTVRRYRDTLEGWPRWALDSLWTAWQPRAISPATSASPP